MVNRVSKRYRNKLMYEILKKMDMYHCVDIAEERDFIKEVDSNCKKSSALEYLSAKGYITLSKNPVTHKLFQIHITNLGMTYFEDLAESRRTKQVSWVQYIITTVIAVLGLIVAILAFALELVSRLSQQ